MTQSPVRYTFDTEFVDDGQMIELISIGIICIDDLSRSYYAVNASMNFTRLMRAAGSPYEWLRSNVVPHLPTRQYSHRSYQIELDRDNPVVKRKSMIADEVRQFLIEGDGRDPEDRNQRELWAYYAAYDHVVLAQLWGMMINLPPGVPMFTRDIKDWAVRLGNPELPSQSESDEHDALQDAKHNVVMMSYLEGLETQRQSQ